MRKYFNTIFIPASNEPNGHACMDSWRMPRGSILRCLQRFKFHAPLLAVGLLTLCCTILLSACGEQQQLADMDSVIIDDKRAVIWEERVYIPFCVVSKSDRGAQIGYVDGNRDDRISEFKGFQPEEWIVSWMPMDGGAMLLKEESVVDIPSGLTQEY